MNSTLKLPISIDDIFRGKSVEWERLEYKRGWNPEAVLHTVCAFANDFHNLGGGYIVIGVEEQDGRPVLPPVGIEPHEIDGLQKALLNLGHSAIQPMYHPLTAPYEVDGKWILVIWVPGGETRPYKAKVRLGKDANDWTYYIRKQSSTVRAKGADERELVGLAATVPFDDRYNQQAGIDDLSLRLIDEFLREVGSELADEAESLPMEALGRQMNVVGGPTEAVFPKNAGLMFFNESPERFFPATQIDVVWFPDGAGGDVFEEKTFKGPLSRMTREALDYIRRNYLKETVVKHPDRAEAERFWNFPYAAIEEALVNAVYHRSYEIREPVEVRITPEDLVILSFPGPDRSIRMEDLRVGKAVSRRYRNRRVGEFLKELDLTEGRSTGIPKMLRIMKANGSPAPVFETDEDRSYYLVRLAVHPEAEDAGTKLGPSQGLGRDQVEKHEKSSVKGTKLALSRHQVDVLCNCMKARGIGELMDLSERTDRTKYRDQVLNPLLDLNLVEMTIPDKPTSSKQKYRITDKGKRFLEER